VLSGRFCHARIGEGAYLNGERLTARTSGESPAIAAISVLFADPARRAALMDHIAPHYRMVDIPRCAAEQYPRLATGVNDVSIFERTLAWDHAAGVLFLNEAGGKAARFDGTPYRVDEDRKGLIGASSPACGMNWRRGWRGFDLRLCPPRPGAGQCAHGPSVLARQALRAGGTAAHPGIQPVADGGAGRIARRHHRAAMVSAQDAQTAVFDLSMADCRRAGCPDNRMVYALIETGPLYRRGRS
jgi:hypothetical protein